MVRQTVCSIIIVVDNSKIWLINPLSLNKDLMEI